MVSEVQANLDPALGFHPPAREKDQAVTSQRSVQASTETSALLNVVTADGDKVTLSANTETYFGYLDIHQQNEGSGQVLTTHAQATEVSVSHEFQVSVEGDLDKEELKDIQRLAKRLSKVVRQFLKGNLDNAVHKAAKIVDKFGKLDSLSSFGFAFEHKETVSVAYQQTQVTGAPTPVPPPVTSETAPEGQEGTNGNSVQGPESVQGSEAVPPVTNPQSSEGDQAPPQVSSPVESEVGSAEVESESPQETTTSTGALGVENSEESPQETLVGQVLQVIQSTRVSRLTLVMVVPQLITNLVSELKQDPEIEDSKSFLEEFQAEVLKKFNESESDPTKPESPTLSLVA